MFSDCDSNFLSSLVMDHDVSDEKEPKEEEKYIKQNWHQKRAIQREEVRLGSIRGPGNSSLTRSLQEVNVKYNLIKLRSLLNATSSKSRNNKLNCLITILETLFPPSTSRTNIDIVEMNSPE